MKNKQLTAADRKAVEVLGHKPNLKNAAKTTFAIPENIIQQW